MRILSVVLLSACATAGADPSTTASEVRRVDAFHGIEIAGTLEVEARVDRTARVEVFAEPADLLPKLTTTVKDGVLILDTKGIKMKSRTKLRAVITTPSLDALAINGTGDMRVSNLGTASLDTSINGTGVLQLTGKVQSLRLSVNGTGEIRAKDLQAAAVAVDVNGTAEASIHATESVDARIAGTGAIRIHGRPATVRKSVTGTGVIDVR